ncbi:MAG: nickel pincer cofactor biosynthesis protein LarC [Myxococcota bacterium]|nr:nickel pincer cofactor biosynthesis protein LarC [Myxococcota bacterium]
MLRDSGALRGQTLYIDCFSGVAGDMMLGALLDLGVPESVVRQALLALPLSGWELRVERVRRGSLMGTKVHVDIEPQLRWGSVQHDQGETGGATHPGEHPHVHYAEIRRMIQHASLPPEVLQRAVAIFDRIALVEAELHGVPVDQVLFHEVGAVDSIIDIVGTAAALAHLQPLRVVARPVPLGGGMVRSAHGLLPVPAPATLALLRGAPVEPGGIDVELTTPTGAGILAASVECYAGLPPMRVLATGWGAGERELPDRPNLLRLVAGTELGPAPAPEAARCLVVEANIDDMSPELCEPLLLALQEAGARDVWFVPVHMKKNRPGFIVGALCEAGVHEQVVDTLLRESTTLGVRSHGVDRTVLDREQVEVQTRFGPVLVKVGRRHGVVWNVAPEYESCRAVAHDQGVPVKQVYAAALAAYGTGAVS